MWAPMTRPLVFSNICKICVKWFLMCFDCTRGTLFQSLNLPLLCVHWLQKLCAIGIKWILHLLLFWFSTRHHANFIWDLGRGLCPISLVWFWSRFGILYHAITSHFYPICFAQSWAFIYINYKGGQRETSLCFHFGEYTMLISFFVMGQSKWLIKEKMCPPTN
jgi:hypothetical protein